MNHNSNCLTNHLILDRMLGACGCGLPLEFKQHAAPMPGSASKFNHLFILKCSTSAVTWMWCKTCQAKRLRILVTLLGVHQSASMYIWYAPFLCVLTSWQAFPAKKHSITNPRHDPWTNNPRVSLGSTQCKGALRKSAPKTFSRFSPAKSWFLRQHPVFLFRRMLEVADRVHLVHDVHGGVADDRWNKAYMRYIYI